VPVPSIVLVLVLELVVALTPAPPVVVVVVDSFVVCAKAEFSANALTAPTANILINIVCFIVCPLLGLNGCFPSCMYLTVWGRCLFNGILFSCLA
jgi:hypothetical protein